MKDEKIQKTYATADKTRKKLITAARKTFVKNGFAGSSITQIANLAKINRSLIFHHFDTKENLWLIVKEQITSDAKIKYKNKSILPSKELPFKDFIRELLHNTINFYRQNPDIIAMINWQRIERETITIGSSSESKLWLSAFEHYKLSGDISSKIKAEQVLCLIVGIAGSAGMDSIRYLKKLKDLDDYINCCVDIIIKGA